MVARAVTDQFGSDDDLLLTRLAPPPQQARLLRRIRVETQLAAALDHPLCLLVAPAGSGKTTAMASLAAHGGWPVAWCRAHADDDPALLLRHLVAAFRPIVELDERRIFAVRSPDADQAVALALETLVNELAAALDDDTLLVIDDYQVIDARPELRLLLDQLLMILPLRLHVALLSRLQPILTCVETARVRGELLLIRADQLAFDLDEAQALWQLADHPPPTTLDTLVRTTRGWAITMQVALGATDWRAVLGLHSPAPFDAYLATQLFDPLSTELRHFLLANAGLRRLHPELCTLLADTAAPELLLAELERRSLCVERDTEGLLLIQPVMQAFLERRARTELPNWSLLQQRAARFYHQRGDGEGLIYHLLLAGDDQAAADMLIEYTPELLAAGRAAQLLAWTYQLTPLAPTLPRLYETQAAALRCLGRSDEALRSYMTAEARYAATADCEGQLRTLRGRAELYLDTVQPAHATDLLKRALKLLPVERTAERAELVRMQAENWANRGRADVALLLESAAHRLLGQNGSPTRKPEADAPQIMPTPLPPRLLLRAGRLNEARQQLEAEIRADSSRSGGAHLGGHREPLLLLALIYAMLGNGARALAMARRGLVEAQRAATPLTEAIAELRLGHAYQLVAPNDLTPVLQRYTRAVSLIQAVGVNRTRAEAAMGLTLLYAHAADLDRAESDAHEGLQIATAAGDAWTAALILLALGGAAVAAGDRRASEWLEQARQRFARGGDSYGLALTRLWRAIAALQTASPSLDSELEQLFSAVATHGYSGVLIAPSLFGPRDMALLVPLLLRGRALAPHAELAQALLRQGFPTIAADDMVEDYHPGYTLRIQLFGTFRVWRGPREIHAREWQREKARQLFQLLITHRGHWVQREQICSWLWPEADLEAAERQFKVTLNALNSALEPARPPRVAPFFIRRQGLAYSFAPSYGVWIDVDEFELRSTASSSSDRDFSRHNAQIAVHLYRGDYLAESLYDAWTIEERERLMARYLATATRYAARLSDEGDQAEAVQLCEQLLRRERCYEEAYQILMRAHARAGSRSQALRSYVRCSQALRDELGIEPLPETRALYESLKRNEAI